MLTEKQFRQVFPRNRHFEMWLRPLVDTFSRFAINTPLRKAHFLAQLAVESNELQTLEENLHYSPQRLVQVWPKRFHDITAALRYARNPERLANYVYADRNGNGDEASGDGWRYRGRGAIQLTGKGNYKVVGEMLGENLINTPDMLLEPKWAALSAGAFWSRNGVNRFADDDDVALVTGKVNGGVHGLEARKRYLIKAKEVLGVIDGDRADQDSQTDQGGPIGTPDRKKAPQEQASGWFD